VTDLGQWSAAVRGGKPRLDQAATIVEERFRTSERLCAWERLGSASGVAL
jgi:hypothetical protein